MHTDAMYLRVYPLGEGAWLMRTKEGMRLQTQTGYFVFYHNSWKKYKRHAHRRIHFLLRHGEGERCQYDADDESLQPYRSRRSAPRMRWKITSRATRNARATNFRRKKRSTLSKWHHSNTRSYPSERSRGHVSRIEDPNSFTSVTDEDIQYSDECTIEEETQPVDDSVQ